MSLHALLMNQLRFDASYGAYLDTDLQALEAELYRTVYVDLKARQWLPLKTDVPAGAEFYGYRVLDGVGRADIIPHDSDELPMAGIRVEKKLGNIVELGNAFGYSKQELRAAAMTNMPLDRELALLQMRAHEEKFNAITLLGVEQLGLIGFFKHPDVSVTAMVDWDNAGTTGTQILADLRKLYNQILTQSKGMWVPNQIILPLSSYLAAQSRPMGADYSVQENPLNVFIRTTATPVEVGWDINLETAGAGSTKRAVVYMKDARVAQCVQPLAPEISEPQLVNLVYKRTIESRVGACAIKQPLAIAYGDGM